MNKHLAKQHADVRLSLCRFLLPEKLALYHAKNCGLLPLINRYDEYRHIMDKQDADTCFRLLVKECYRLFILFMRLKSTRQNLKTWCLIEEIIRKDIARNYKNGRQCTSRTNDEVLASIDEIIYEMHRKNKLAKKMSMNSCLLS